MTAAKRTVIVLVVSVCLLMPGFAHSEYAGPDTCADCHSDIYENWKVSIHAKAYTNDFFQKSWKENDQKPACLDCHTTGHNKDTLTFIHNGVSCESCHGAMSQGHPDSAKMSVPISSEMCQSCHQKTYKEWKMSKHGGKNIRCFDCHNVHSQGLRAGGGDTLCGSCHSNRLTDFAHSTHHSEGLHCSTCHMPAYKSHETNIEGTGAAGHTLFVGGEVCSRCHEDTVHKSAMLPQLREKVTEINQEMSVAGVSNVFDLNEKVKELQWHLARSRQSLWVAAVLFFLIGLSLGWLGGWYLYVRKRTNGNHPPR
jgi:hypothetical protein